MYGIYRIHNKYPPNVAEYTIHGWYGSWTLEESLGHRKVHVCKGLVLHIPDAPCMEYLPTCTIMYQKFKPYVGKYIHGAGAYGYMLHMFFLKLKQVGSNHHENKHMAKPMVKRYNAFSRQNLKDWPWSCKVVTPRPPNTWWVRCLNTKKHLLRFGFSRGL